MPFPEAKRIIVLYSSSRYDDLKGPSSHVTWFAKADC